MKLRTYAGPKRMYRAGCRHPSHKRWRGDIRSDDWAEAFNELAKHNRETHGAAPGYSTLREKR